MAAYPQTPNFPTIPLGTRVVENPGFLIFEADEGGRIPFMLQTQNMMNLYQLDHMRDEVDTGIQDVLRATATSGARLQARLEGLGRQVAELGQTVQSLINVLERYDLVPKMQPHGQFLGVAPGVFEAAIPAGFGGGGEGEESESESEYEEGVYLFGGEEVENSEYDADDDDEELGDLETDELGELIW